MPQEDNGGWWVHAAPDVWWCLSVDEHPVEPANLHVYKTTGGSGYNWFGGDYRGGCETLQAAKDRAVAAYRLTLQTLENDFAAEKE